MFGGQVPSKERDNRASPPPAHRLEVCPCVLWAREGQHELSITTSEFIDTCSCSPRVILGHNQLPRGPPGVSRGTRGLTRRKGGASCAYTNFSTELLHAHQITHDTSNIAHHHLHTTESRFTREVCYNLQDAQTLDIPGATRINRTTLCEILDQDVHFQFSRLHQCAVNLPTRRSRPKKSLPGLPHLPQ